jgi:hypothetical protein
MPAPDSTIEEVRASVLRYLRLYEEGQITMGDLAAELAVMALPYEHAIGGIEDHYAPLLGAATRYASSGPFDFEQAMTRFRRSDAAWEA